MNSQRDPGAGYIFLQPLCKAEYVPKDNRIILQIHPEMKPYYLQLKREFTPIVLEYLIGLNSIYSLRLYELLKQREKLFFWKITVTELKILLCVEDKYDLYGHFKSRVLDIAQDELKEKTDIYFTYKEVLKGRSVDTLYFSIKHNLTKEEKESLKEQKEALNSDENDPIKIKIREDIEASLKEGSQYNNDII